MEKQKEEARASWAGSGEAQTEPIWFKLREWLGATEFLGYDAESAEGEVLALVQNGEAVQTAKAGEEVAVVVNQTPFYAESGGQVADTGTIANADGGSVAVENVQKRADGLFVHLGKVEAGSLAVGDAVRLTIDRPRRTMIRANHSATHLLHAALRNVLGTHVAQKGSLVAPDRLRFDFSHPKPMDAHEIEAVEDLANAVVLEDAPVVTRLMDRDEAMKSGAMALFGEKYGDEVRVVSMGTMPEDAMGKTYSVELCGGTHVGRTGEIGLITLVDEGAVAAGVRRIEALTGNAARKHLAEQEKRLRAVAMALKSRPEEAAERVEVLVEERRKLERDLAEARKKLAMGGGGNGGGDDNAIVDVGGVKFFRLRRVGCRNERPEGARRRGQGEGRLRRRRHRRIRRSEGKGSIVVGVTDDLTDRFNAIDLVRKGAEALGGKGGGGRPDMAQAGGPDGAKADKALAAIEAAIAAAMRPRRSERTEAAGDPWQRRRRAGLEIVSAPPSALRNPRAGAARRPRSASSSTARSFSSSSSISSPSCCNPCRRSRRAYGVLFAVIEIVSLVVFTVEYGSASGLPPNMRRSAAGRQGTAADLCAERRRHRRPSRHPAVLARPVPAGRSACAAGLPHRPLPQARPLFAGDALAARRALQRTAGAVRMLRHPARRGARRRLGHVLRRARGPAGQVRHHPRRDVVGDRHARHHWLWRRRPDDGARPLCRHPDDLRQPRDDRAAGRHHRHGLRQARFTAAISS